MNDIVLETLEEGDAAGAPVPPVRPHLFLALEADRPLGGGARHALSGIDEVVIGRGAKRTFDVAKHEGRTRLSVRVPGPWMSSTHARLVRTRGAWVLEDAGSRNGTYVRGERVGRRTLADGDVFEAGHTLFAFRDALPTPPHVTPGVDMADLVALAPGLRSLLPVEQVRLEEFTRVARSLVPMLLLGETGTGKELLARAAHDLSGRRGRFVAVNCGGLAPSLVEGLLFGHVKGAFSGAAHDEPGFLRAADGGTLFLDELGDFPAPAQPTLLRALQQREVVPIGTTRPIPLELRVVCATHRDLDALVASGGFRRDLLARVDGYRFALAPLRRRREDIGLLVADMLPRLASDRAEGVTLKSAAARALLAHDWPGNARELELVLARALALAPDGNIDVPQLGFAPSADAPLASPPPNDADAQLRGALVEALARHEGNVSEVARAMGKARMQIQRWIRRFGIDPESYRRSR